MPHRFSSFAGLIAETEAPHLDAQTVYVLGGILSLLGIYVLILMAVRSTRETFGRRPSVEVDLMAKADAKDLDHVRVSMKGFATAQDLEAVQKEHHLRARGLEEQISGLRHDLKNEYDARVIAVRDTVEQFGEIRAQIKASDDNHQKAVNEINRQGEERIAKVHDRLNIVVREIGSLESTAKSTADGVVRLQQSIENIIGKLPARGGAR